MMKQQTDVTVDIDTVVRMCIIVGRAI